jgi:hypothetical protein
MNTFACIMEDHGTIEFFDADNTIVDAEAFEIVELDDLMKGIEVEVVEHYGGLHDTCDILSSYVVSWDSSDLTADMRNDAISRRIREYAADRGWKLTAIETY